MFNVRSNDLIIQIILKALYYLAIIEIISMWKIQLDIKHVLYIPCNTLQ